MKARVSALLVVIASGAIAQDNASDPPERVARISYLSGEASLRTAGAAAPETAVVNWPMTAGDGLHTASDTRAEVSLGLATIRLDGESNFHFLELDQSTTQVRIESGTALIHLRDLRPPGESFAVQMRQAKMQLLRPGLYRIAVLDDGQIDVEVREGEVQVNTGSVSYQQLPGEAARIAVDRTLAITQSKKPRPFDLWAQERQRQMSGRRALQHVPRGLVGFEDLDAYGAWRWEPAYGMVWQPQRVAATWAPYRFGEWIWKEPWGWTWIDAAPWGFAPFHYGRWAQLRSGWSWLPGPRQIPPVYAPALVGWAEDSEKDAVGWYPLGPGERFALPYRASAQHARRLNIFANARSMAASAGVASHGDRNRSLAMTWTDRVDFAGHPLPLGAQVERLASDRRERGEAR